MACRPRARQRGPGFQGSALGNAMQPTPQLFARHYHRGLERQHQEGRLKHILGLMEIGQDPPADAQRLIVLYYGLRKAF
jgi:hypothetical protein